MADGLVEAELRVLVAQRVERVGVGREDLVEAGLPEGGHVLLDEHLVEALLADPADVVAGVALVLVEDAEVDAGVVENPGQRAGQLGDPFVEAGVVADEPQVADGLGAGVLRLEVEALGPPGPLAGRLPEAVALGGQVLQGVLQARLHLPLVDQRPAQLDDRRDVLDAHGAGLDAGHARRAGPQRLGLDDVAGQLRVPRGRLVKPPSVAVAGQGARRRRPVLPVEHRVEAVLAVDPLAEVEDEVAR